MIIAFINVIIIFDMQEKEIALSKQIIRYVIYTLIVLGLTALAFYLTIGKNASSIFETLKSANLWFVFMIFAILLACIILRSVAIFFLTKTYVSKYSFHRAMAIDQVGVLYRMVTPAGLGGHVMEAYTYKKQGISLANALSVLAMYSIIYQIVLILYNLITIIVKHNLVSEINYVNISFIDTANVNVSLWLLVGIGFGINVLVIGFILLISYWNGFYRFLDGPIGKLLAKVRIVKDIDAYHQKMLVARDSYRNNLKNIFKHWPTFIICFVVFFAYITLTYSVPYFAGLALSNASIYANFWDAVLLSNFHQMITCIITPGNSLFSELFFLRLFYPSSGPSFFSSEQVARASLLLWRSLVFIIPLFIACIWTIIYRPRKVIDNGED